ncbi:hypothetical protein BK654_16540 [Pseudomonas brassicacearum]|nr:hypothetical protein BK654_16540 [Pseudomonas brassicacearum]
MPLAKREQTLEQMPESWIGSPRRKIIGDMQALRAKKAWLGQIFLQLFLFLCGFRPFLTNYSKNPFSRYETSLFFSLIDR